MTAIEFTVKGRGTFPTDMLRYDACWPARGEDVNWMEVRGERELTLRKCFLGGIVEAKRQIRTGILPTRLRWESYGWEVTGVKIV